MEPARFAHSVLLDALPDAIVIVDSEGRIVELNVQLQRLVGYTRHELLGKPVESLMPERFRDRHVAERDRYGRTPHVRPMGVDLEVYVRHRDGHEIPVEISLAPYQSPDGPLVVSAIREVPAPPRARPQPE
ncbi:MAG: PAS domain S-box protein [Gemmatimonadales bacterium]|nr:PAS domain S-box protein [Gemmatimonadales bacterium]NIN50505.1 PAS domain S-box protein [Gemmatimonadales bacterium]NIP07969.1 PAS domain S-box protein [Gemmatimonadales bacterium]NIR01991.1 PAS domain S-box protein [Gemmatimonadales bacterium]